MTIIKLIGVLVDILYEITSEHKAKRGVKKYLLHCQSALYGKMVASMLYYCKFIKSFTSIGFDINPYDPCVATNVIDNSQMTICFNVDGWKLSHCKSKANDWMINCLRQEYESIFEDGSGNMSVIQGKVHEYPGMTLDYTAFGHVRIIMLSYIE